MRFKDKATLKRLYDEADEKNFRRNTQIEDDELIMPVIRLLNCMLINGYQS